MSVGREEAKRAEVESLIWMTRKTTRAMATLKSARDTGNLIHRSIADTLAVSLQAAINQYEIAIGTLVAVTKDPEVRKQYI